MKTHKVHTSFDIHHLEIGTCPECVEYRELVSFRSFRIGVLDDNRSSRSSLCWRCFARLVRRTKAQDERTPVDPRYDEEREKYLADLRERAKANQEVKK